MLLLRTSPNEAKTTAIGQKKKDRAEEACWNWLESEADAF